MKTIFFFLLLFLSGAAQASIYDLGDSSGLTKETAGNFYQLNTAGTATATKSGTNLSLLEKVNVPTSKGSFAFDLARSVPVDINRVGKAMRVLAVATGPVGLAVSVVDAICSLSSICNSAGDWHYLQPGGFDLNSTAAGTLAHDSLGCSGSTLQIVLTCVYSKFSDGRTHKSLAYDGSLTNRVVVTGQLLPNFPSLSMGKIYSVNYSTIPYSGAVDVPATSSHWDTAESKLNDQRFIQPLLDKNAPVPVGAPTITTPQKVPIGSETKTTKDGSGNTTGTETTTTEAEITQPSGAENPTNSPSVIKITENTTVNNYNTSNQLTSSTTTVSSTQTPVQTQQEPITITIDSVPDVPLQTVAVPGTFSFTSWGSGSCPSPKTWNTMFGTQIFSYQLTCDFATTAKPIILLIAAIVSFMIVASIRTE